MSKNLSNLKSLNRLEVPCNLHDMSNWVNNEIRRVDELHHRAVVQVVCDHIDSFVKWPQRPLLLACGCNRNSRYHSYSEEVESLAKAQSIRLDTRANGPAITSFLVAGGTRPQRYGSTNQWSIHHIYSGKFPYVDKNETLHAAKHGNHFTQSAGLVAIHPVADALCDEYPFFSWLLRATSFFLFRYDPDEVFSTRVHNVIGFVGGV